MPSSQKLQIWLKPNCTWMFIGWSSTILWFFVPIWNSKWRLQQDLFNIGPYGKNVSNCFFSETTRTVETKLPRNYHWKVLYKFSVFYADWKSKMAATTGYSINTGPYGENTEIYSSLKLLHWLNLNCESIIGRSFSNFVFFMLIVIPRWLPLQDIVFT